MITIDINPNAFVIGSFILSWHGFFTVVGVVMAVILSGRWASITVADAKSKTTIDPEIIYSTATWGILGGIIGACVGSGDLIRTKPRRSGRIWHTPQVIPAKECKPPTTPAR